MLIHLDADAFFASVEQAADSRLRGKAMAVGGMKRGIIASASYEARRYGVYTPMPASRAMRACPHLILVPGDFEKYEFFSRLMFSYAYDFTPEVEITSIDEGYFDMAGNRRVEAGAAADTIRKAVAQRLKIGVSQGVASNKLVSQIASKLRKPHGFVAVPHGEECTFLAPLDVRWLPGVGPKLGQVLKTAGLTRIAQIPDVSIDLLRLLTGRGAETLRDFSRGVDARPVVTTRAPAKSYGHQRTFQEDTIDEPFLTASLRKLIDDLILRMRRDEKCARTLSIKIRYTDMDEVERSESLLEPTGLAEDFYPVAERLFTKTWDRRVRIRMLRAKFSNIYHSADAPLPGLFDADRHRKRASLQDALVHLRAQFGPRALMRSHDLLLNKI